MSISANYRSFENHQRITSVMYLNYTSIQHLSDFMSHYNLFMDTVWLEHMGDEATEEDLHNAHKAIGRLYDFICTEGYRSPLSFVDGFYCLLIEEVDRATGMENGNISRGILSDVCDVFTCTFNLEYR